MSGDRQIKIPPAKRRLKETNADEAKAVPEIKIANSNLEKAVSSIPDELLARALVSKIKS